MFQAQVCRLQDNTFIPYLAATLLGTVAGQGENKPLQIQRQPLSTQLGCKLICISYMHFYVEENVQNVVLEKTK